MRVFADLTLINSFSYTRFKSISAAYFFNPALWILPQAPGILLICNLRTARAIWLHTLSISVKVVIVDGKLIATLQFDVLQSRNCATEKNVSAYISWSAWKKIYFRNPYSHKKEQASREPKRRKFISHKITILFAVPEQHLANQKLSAEKFDRNRFYGRRGNRVAFTQQQSETINGRGTPGAHERVFCSNIYSGKSIDLWLVARQQSARAV